MQRYRNGQEHAARNLFPIPIRKLGQHHFAILKIDNAPPTFRARRREALKLSNSTDSFGSKIHQSCPPNPAPLGRETSAANFSPQGGCGIRKAAKPLTAAQAVRRRQIILIRFCRDHRRGITIPAPVGRANRTASSKLARFIRRWRRFANFHARGKKHLSACKCASISECAQQAVSPLKTMAPPSF